MSEQTNELVRFSFKGQLLRITRDTGFELSRDGEHGCEWIVLHDTVSVFGDDLKVAQALDTLIVFAATFDGIEKDMGKQMFLAAMRIPTMISLGFGDAVLN
jgi:hypothetical protein